MAKTTSPKKSTKKIKEDTAFSRKNNDQQTPAQDNMSKFQPTEEAQMDTLSLDPEDGVLKLFTDCIKDIYWAENHLVKALPKMIKAASLDTLQQGISDHLEKTKVHVQRLEQVFEILGKQPQAKKCDAMEGLTKEGEGAIETTDAGTPARDLAIILSSQKVEHYEISSYTGLIKLANNLGYPEIADLLSQTLAEEEESDTLLADIADNEVVSFFDKGDSMNSQNDTDTDESEDDETLSPEDDQQ